MLTSLHRYFSPYLLVGLTVTGTLHSCRNHKGKAAVDPPQTSCGQESGNCPVGPQPPTPEPTPEPRPESKPKPTTLSKAAIQDLKVAGVVAFYRKLLGYPEPEVACSGILLKPDLVLAPSHCARDENVGTVSEGKRFLVKTTVEPLDAQPELSFVGLSQAASSQPWSISELPELEVYNADFDIESGADEFPYVLAMASDGLVAQCKPLKSSGIRSVLQSKSEVSTDAEYQQGCRNQMGSPLLKSTDQGLFVVALSLFPADSSVSLCDWSAMVYADLTLAAVRNEISQRVAR